MKKLLSLIASLCLCVACAFGLSACGKDGRDGTDGTNGKDGVSVESAYFDDDGNLIIKLTDGKELNCGQVKVEAQESLHYRPVVEDGKIAGYSVKNIGSVSDTEIIIPSRYRGLPVTGIDDNAFYGCDWISSVTIPDSVKSIGKSAFSKCENIKSVRVSSVAAWCNISFANTSANPMYFAAELYEGDKLVENIVIPDSVTSIPDYAFYGCGNIKSVTIGKSVTSIGCNSFYGCEKLESVKIGGKVTEMGELAFADCAALKTLEIGGEVELIGEYAFMNCSSIESVTIPASVKRIEEAAFMSCTGITTLNLNEGLQYIGDSAFANCSGLSEFNMPQSVTDIGFGILMFGGGSGFDPIGGIANQVNKIVLSDKLTEIPDFAFSFCTIKTIVLGGKVKKLNYAAFYGCDRLESIVIPESVTRITSYAFYKCPLLNTVYFAGTAEEWNAVKIGKSGNDTLTGENDTELARIYYYSEEQAEGCWHYVGGTPTKW